MVHVKCRLIIPSVNQKNGFIVVHWKKVFIFQIALFGTDFPMWSPKEELARFLSLGLDESSRQKILYENFMKLLKLHDEDEESTKRGDAHVSDRH